MPAATETLDVIRPACVAGREKVFGLSESQIARRVKAIARAAGNRAAAWSAVTPAASPPDQRYGIFNLKAVTYFTLITAQTRLTRGQCPQTCSYSRSSASETA